MGTKGIPSRRGPLLQDAEVGAVNRHEAVVGYDVGAKPALEDNLGGGSGRQGGGEKTMADVSNDEKYYSPRRPPTRQWAP